MTISVDWTGAAANPYRILVEKADMTLVQAGPPEIYELDVDAFRLTLRDLEDDPDGRPWPKTHVHDTETLLSGVIYARKVTILEPYTVEFENGTYQVNCVGANHNIGDRKVVNSVSLLINNSAGLTVPTSPESIAAVVWDELLSAHTTAGSAGEALQFLSDRFRGEWEIDLPARQMVIYRPGGAELIRFDLFNALGPAVTDIIRRVPA
jgi:hypothetical protein